MIFFLKYTFNIFSKPRDFNDDIMNIIPIG